MKKIKHMNYIKYLKRIIRKVFINAMIIFGVPVIRILTFLFSKNPNLVLLGSMSGSYFADNAAHLYNWMRKDSNDWRPIWMTRSKLVLHRLRSAGLPVMNIYSPKSWWIIARAHAIAFTNGLEDVVLSHYYIPNRCRVLYLSHGIPIKRGRHARLGQPLSPSELKRSQQTKAYVTDYISSSPFNSKCRAEAVNINIGWYQLTGLPRTDVLIQQKNNLDKTKLHSLFAFNNNTPKNVVLYGPSWRHGRAPTRFFPFQDFDMTLLIRVLEELDAVILVRSHKNDLQFSQVRKCITNLTTDNNRIIDATFEQIEDINNILTEIDVLISDYSGLIGDYLLLDRPCILVPYDIAEYEAKNGFYYDYRSLAPGPIVSSFKEFINALQSAFQDPNQYAAARSRLRDLYFTHQDGKACECVAEILKKPPIVTNKKSIVCNI